MTDPTKGAPPVLEGNGLVLFATKEGAKNDFYGKYTDKTTGEETEIAANIRVNTRTGKAFLSILKVVKDEQGGVKLEDFGTANPINTIHGEPVNPEKTRRMLVNLHSEPGHSEATPSPEAKESNTISVFIQKGMSTEVFKAMGFEGDMKFRTPTTKPSTPSTGM